MLFSLYTYHRVRLREDDLSPSAIFIPTLPYTTLQAMIEISWQRNTRPHNHRLHKWKEDLFLTHSLA